MIGKKKIGSPDMSIGTRNPLAPWVKMQNSGVISESESELVKGEPKEF
jgi:hypothetical protein